MDGSTTSNTNIAIMDFESSTDHPSVASASTPAISSSTEIKTGSEDTTNVKKLEMIPSVDAEP